VQGTVKEGNVNRLDAIEARVNAATEGPWYAWLDEDEHFEVDIAREPMPPYRMNSPKEPICRSGCGHCGGFARHEDREFAARSRTDVPLLLAAVRAAAGAVANIPAEPPEGDSSQWSWCIDARKVDALRAALAPLLEPEP
jgi:hypothetical protein